jgi:hypothetical protein
MVNRRRDGGKLPPGMAQEGPGTACLAGSIASKAITPKLIKSKLDLIVDIFHDPLQRCGKGLAASRALELTDALG